MNDYGVDEFIKEGTEKCCSGKINQQMVMELHRAKDISAVQKLKIDILIILH